MLDTKDTAGIKRYKKSLPLWNCHLVAKQLINKTETHTGTSVAQVWWSMTVIPACGKLKQEDHQEFKAILDCIGGPCLKKTKFRCAKCITLQGEKYRNKIIKNPIYIYF